MSGELQVEKLPIEKPGGLKVVSIGALLSEEFPPRSVMLSPWLCSQSLNMVYSWRGVGKTHFALNVAYAVASGGNWLGWEATEPFEVLYVDGEMPGITLQERLSSIVAASVAEPPDGHLQIITPDLNRHRGMPDLTTIRGQAEIDEQSAEAKLIVIDNLSCLARGGKENEAESWQIVADWALRMRAAGKSVLFVHHAGKGGQQRGTSKREDILDSVISLRHPKDYEHQEGARFQIYFEKARALHGETITPIETKLDIDDVGAQTWTTKKVDDAIREQIMELKAAGMTQRQIASELEIGVGTVNRHLNK